MMSSQTELRRFLHGVFALLSTEEAPGFGIHARHLSSLCAYQRALDAMFCSLLAEPHLFFTA